MAFSKEDVYTLRCTLKMSQTAFAAKCGVTQRTISLWEQGATIPEYAQILLGYIQKEITTQNQQATSSIIGDSNKGNYVGGISEKALLEIIKNKDEQIAKRDAQIEKLIDLMDRQNKNTI